MRPHGAETSPDTHLWSDSAQLLQSHPVNASFFLKAQNEALTQSLRGGNGWESDIYRLER